MKKTILFLFAVMLVVGVVTVLWAGHGLSDFDLSKHETREVSFEHGDVSLAGTLVLPKNATAPPIAIFVHGDGAQGRFSADGYLPLINAFVDVGIGVFSWDKAGVGASIGNWLHQTMDDRADEAIAALDAVSAIDGVDPHQIGFLGFSQAGWVLPRVANRITPAFTIIVGGAVSWRDQGTYFSRVKMASQGFSETEIDLRLMDRAFKNDLLFLSPDSPPPASEQDSDRFRFVASAYWEDSTDLIASMTGPVFAIWGDADLNVDARTDSGIYREQLAPLTATRRVDVVANATHGLLRADLFNFQLSSEWPPYLQALFVGMGRRAYADNSIDQIADWVLSVTNGPS